MLDTNEQLKIPEDSHGTNTKQLMYKFSGYCATVNELRIRLLHKVNKQKAIINKIKNEATIIFFRDNKYEEKRGSAPYRDASIALLEVEVNINFPGEEPYNLKSTTSKQQDILIDLENKLAKAEGRLDDLNRLISACQSGLKWDQAELRNMQ